MPIYQYRCERCGHKQENFSKIIEDEEKEGRLVISCPVCNSQMGRMLSAFYLNNYPVKAVRVNGEEVR